MTRIYQEIRKEIENTRKAIRELLDDIEFYTNQENEYYKKACIAAKEKDFSKMSSYLIQSEDNAMHAETALERLGDWSKKLKCLNELNRQIETMI